ncbi:MAG TPA: hypothetical protein PK147_11330 [Saprospiraceae bacterium]|nr:hypothetical protein [Saprospiraceae bacterium]MCB9327582.1 hypothetical protein [Lewinellaceae bacterium]HPK10236.1 hypothetical protein [Saprospiraceae bacterium]HPQ22438.1 hypothetical protein [Saprospiraceae bacterium]
MATIQEVFNNLGLSSSAFYRSNSTPPSLSSKLICLTDAKTLISNYDNRNSTQVPTSDNSNFNFETDLIKDYFQLLKNYATTNNLTINQVNIALGAKQVSGSSVYRQSLLFIPCFVTSENAPANLATDLLVLDFNDCCGR